MPGLPKYYIVEATALPEVFLKVAETSYNLETGKAATIGEAVKQTGISRSAFYKYRDSIKPFFNTSSTNMVTFHMVLQDEPGVLSGILREFANSVVNILTINQSIPINGVASVTISAENAGTNGSMEELLDSISKLNGVTKIEIVAGER
jgi:chorismate mutase